MALDVGTLGSTPVLISINKMLIEMQDKNYTKYVTSIYHKVKNDLAQLRKLKDFNLKFYGRMLNILREHHLKMMDANEDKLPKVLFTHLRCAIVSEFRTARQEIAEGLKENVRRRQRGQPPL